MTWRNPRPAAQPGTAGRAAPVRVEAHAVRIAEAVCSAWHCHDSSGRLDVPVSVVAGLRADQEHRARRHRLHRHRPGLDRTRRR
jgi:hypothetical protein